MKLMNDWKCQDEDCDGFNKTLELFLHREQKPACEQCGGELQKVIGGLKIKHVSWSTWRL